MGRGVVGGGAVSFFEKCGVRPEHSLKRKGGVRRSVYAGEDWERRLDFCFKCHKLVKV